MIFVILALLALLKSPEIGRNSCLSSAVATMGQGACPVTAACALPFRFTQNAVLRISRKHKTTDNDRKRNNNVQT